MERARVTIVYRRPPDRIEVFEQEAVHHTPEWTVTYLPEAGLSKAAKAGGRIILEPGSPIVWFTYPGRWHDIGRFHLANGEFTGYYANVLTPVEMNGARWETTDLFLDVWLPREGEPELLDEEELEAAVANAWITEDTAARAREHAAELLAGAGSGDWPPAHVREWTLARVRERLGYSLDSSTDAETSRFRST